MPDASSAVAIPLPEGGHLAADYVRADSPFAVVWAHGFGSHRGGEKAAAVRATCERRGWPFVAADFRGHGGSPGTMPELTPARLLEDLAAVRRFLADCGHTRFGLVGSSMGGFAAAWFAARNPEAVVGCVLLAPAFGFLERRWNQLTDAERDEWRRTGRRRVTNEWVDVEVGYALVEERERYDPRVLAAGWRTPALLFHGWADDTVPVADSLAFLERVDYPHVELRLLKDGDHRLTAHKDEIAAEAGRWFAKVL